MATGTGNLPNKNMSFTPFDILTAEEQNDLVENIESLATGTGIGDSAITTAKIAAKAVTADKIDFATMNVIALSNNTNQTATKDAYLVKFNLTEHIRGSRLTKSGDGILIGQGVTAIRAGFGVMCENASGGHIYPVLTRERGGETTQFAQQIVDGNAYFKSASGTIIIPVSPGDKIRLDMHNSMAGAVIRGFSMGLQLWAEQIG